MVISRNGTFLIHFGIIRGQQFTLMCGLWLFKGISWQQSLVTCDQGESNTFNFQQELLWGYQIHLVRFSTEFMNQGAFRPTQTATTSALYNKQNDLDPEVTRLWRSLSIEGHHCEAELPDMENDLRTKHCILTTRV